MVLTTLALAACSSDNDPSVPNTDTDSVGGTETDTETDADADTDADDPPSGAARYAVIVDAAVGRRMVVAASPLAMSGRVLDLDGRGMPSEIEWSASGPSGGGSGSAPVDPQGGWTASVALEPGDNLVSWAIPDNDARVDVAVVLNDGFAFGGPLTLDRDVAYVDEARTVEAAVALGDPDIGVDLVELVEVQPGGAEARVGALVDDGDLAQGDDAPGDGVYHGQFQILSPTPGRRQYRVVARLTGGGEARSEVRDVLVARHLDPLRFEEQVAAGRAYRERLDAAGSGRATELARIRAELASDPSIADLGASEGGLWMVYDNGVAAVLSAAAEDEKGSGGASAQRSAGPPPPPVPARSPGQLWRAGLRVAGAEDQVGNARVKAIASQYWDWGDADDVPQMRDRLREHGCFDDSSVFDTASGSGSLESYKRLGDYGTVLISTHGDSFFKGLELVWADQWGWDGPFGQVVLHSNHLATVSSLARYEDDIVAGRVVLFYEMFGITPSFIRRYTGQMPNSLVYVSACRGTWDGSMATAFLEAGAGSYFGYSDYVAVGFTLAHGVPLLESLLVPDTTIADAFVAGQVEQDEDAAEFELFGSSSLAFEFTGLQDGGFEGADLRTTWPGGGLGASSVSSLFGVRPTEGSKMAMITSGLGDSNPATISQSFCLEENDTTLSVDWNYISEDRALAVEPDRFRLSVQAATDTEPFYLYETLLYESVDTLGPELTDLEGGYFSPFCPICLETTGWRTLVYTLPEGMRGRRLTVTMAVNQGGGGESAALVDNLRLTP
jgi:hypothetical protein